jgi:hypothetical protein
MLLGHDEQKDKKNTHTKNTYKNTHTNTEVFRKAYGTKAGQGYQVPDLLIYVQRHIVLVTRIGRPSSTLS